MTDDERPHNQSALSCRALRQCATINFFKLVAMERQHLPNESQVKEISLLFEEVRRAGVLDVRTWRSWFPPDCRKARSDAVIELDRFIDARIRFSQSNISDNHDACDFFQSLIQGGLVGELLEPTQSKHPLSTIRLRALEYKARSTVHLHFDAIEAAELSASNGVVSWEDLKKIAAEKIMQVIHERWNPRSGTMYVGNSSVMKFKWYSTVSVQEYSGDNSIDAITAMIDAATQVHYPAPNWNERPVFNDIEPPHIHRLLLAMLLHKDFLIGDRFGEWVLDLVSSALALYARAWPDRYKIFVFTLEPEAYFWSTFRSLFFDDDIVSDKRLSEMLYLIGLESDEEDLNYLREARKWYHWFLRQLGLTPAEVIEAVNHCSRVRPIIFEE